MATALDNVRVEVAFSADPNTTTPAFTDLTSRALLNRSGISVTRGRQDEFDRNAPGRCSLTFDNADGKLTPGHASAYANLKAQNRLRVTYRDPAVDGNLLTANAASMETDSSDWSTNNLFGSLTDAVSVASSTTRAHGTGTKSTLATWPTTAIGSMAGTWVGVVLGRTYTASAWVYVPTGSPDVKLYVGFLAAGTPTSVKDAWVRISVTFSSPTAGNIYVGPKCDSATSGQQCWVDEVQVDEGSSVRTYTTTPPPIVYRFDGYVDGWPTEWPSGGFTESTTTVTAYDIQSRISRGRKLGSVIEETWAVNDPAWHFPLNEAADSTAAGDVVGTGRTLTIYQKGTGGELTFGNSTGPATDGGTALGLTPVNVSNGLYLAGDVNQANYFATGVTLEATFLTSAAVTQTIARITEYYGTYLELRVTSTGAVEAVFRDSWSGAGVNVLNGFGLNNGRTHTARISIDGTGLTKTVRVRVDGGNETNDVVDTTMYLPAISQRLEVGGTSKAASLFTGTISHVALFPSSLDATASTAHATAVSTGFAGERSDQRIARIASWVGIPAGLLALDVGAALIGSVPSNDKNAWDYMQEVSDTEGGNLYVSTAGVITLRNRAYTFDDTAAVNATVAADDIGPDTSLEHNLGLMANDVTVTREGGASFHVRDQASIDAYGSFAASETILAADDLAAFDRANWILTLRAQPVTRLTQLILDALTGTPAASIRGLGIDSRVSVTGMPSQSPTSTFDLRVQGYTEVITDDGWTVTANTTPFIVLTTLELDDTTRGVLDSINRLGY